MKRSISLILVVILLCSLTSYVFAESNEFDFKSVLGSRDGYKYDKFEKSWSYYGAYMKKYSDANIVVGLQTESSSGGNNPSTTILYVKVMDKKGNKLHDVESIDFLIGDDMYSYDSMLPMDTESVVFIAENGLRLLEAINDSNASDVAIRIGMKNKGSITLDELDSSEYGELKEFCRVYLKYNLWDYFADKEEANRYEAYFPLKINGERVNSEEPIA